MTTTITPDPSTIDPYRYSVEVRGALVGWVGHDALVELATRQEA